MIKLFISDLDGCMTDPFITPDWGAYTQIRALNLASNKDHSVPPLSICTGRPMPYAEAQAQILGIRIPFVFESGGGMYDVAENKLTWSPALTDQAKREVLEIKEWSKEHLIKPNKSAIPEFAKFTDIGIIHQETPLIDELYEKSVEYISKNYELFEVHKTEVSVNIILKKANKGEGIKMLCEHFGLQLEEVAYIGDSSGDIPGLKIVGMPFAPSNAAQITKDVAEVTVGRSTNGVLEAYHKIIERNLSGNY
ncbi:MAG: Cof-type HAD-IIB family hydrolase [Balneolaceae bacterium]